MLEPYKEEPVEVLEVSCISDEEGFIVCKGLRVSKDVAPPGTYVIAIKDASPEAVLSVVEAAESLLIPIDIILGVCVLARQQTTQTQPSATTASSLPAAAAPAAASRRSSLILNPNWVDQVDASEEEAKIRKSLEQ